MPYKSKKEFGREECLARLNEYICERDSPPPYPRNQRGEWATWKFNRSKDMDLCLEKGFYLY